MDGQALLDYLRPRRKAMLDALEELVGRESPSRDKPALDALARSIGATFTQLGGAVEIVANEAGGDHVVARFGSSRPIDVRPALVLGHFDTVWPAGTLTRSPFRIEDGRAFGPGTFDMKASLVLIVEALAALRALAVPLPRPVVVVLTSDEEIGSPTSRELIELEARDCVYALVLEPPLPGGLLKTARKGTGGYLIEVEGRAAHAGVEPEKGLSAIRELAHQILKVYELARPEVGTTINVGVVAGGTAANVVAAYASAQVDVRIGTRDEAQRVDEAIRALIPRAPGARVVVSGGLNRPPMERTERTAALFEQARRLGATLGLDLAEGATGGASDGNFTAALGIPTLDGLGAEGAGAHAADEHILIDSLPERAALLATLLLGLEPPAPP
ncbi:MAG: M20 family metallopeptidase [Isosphaeraceae bacterium]|nr:M20 family metallopeptidase [Isosphaeraceae bacterium]